MPKEVIEGVKPTRMELLEIRKKKILAEKGHRLLTEKRDALINEFFVLIKQRNKLREELVSISSEAYTSLLEAQLTLGRERVGEIAEAIPEVNHIETESKTIMGVKVPKIEFKEGKKPVYSFIETNTKFDSAVEKFRKYLSKALEVGEVEGGIRMVGLEIERTKRRVNALEHIRIPKLTGTIKYIETQLEEREREDFVRRKRIKAIAEE